MQQWDVVVVITALVGLFAAVIGPIVRLTKAIARLNTTMESVERDVVELTANNRESHERLWSNAHRQDQVLCDHESRIRVMEDER